MHCSPYFSFCLHLLVSLLPSLTSLPHLPPSPPSLLPALCRYDLATFLLSHPPFFNFTCLEEFIAVEKKKKNCPYQKNGHNDQNEKNEAGKHSKRGNIANTETVGKDSSKEGRVGQHPTRDSAFSLPLSSSNREESDRFQDCSHFLALSRSGYLYSRLRFIVFCVLMGLEHCVDTFNPM